MTGRYAETFGSGLFGIDGILVRIEVSIHHGIPNFEIVGLSGSDGKESRERVRAAIRNTGYEFPNGRIVVNLSPGSLHKEGTGFDLPIALAVLTASGQIRPPESVDPTLSFGELSLKGEVRPVTGAFCRTAVAADHGIGTVIVPEGNRWEAEAIRGIRIQPIRTLSEGIDRITGRWPLGMDPHDRVESALIGSRPRSHRPVRGQKCALRSLGIAAAGMHNLLLIGSPGSGKTLLASQFPEILPELDEMESLEVTRIYSAAGLIPNGIGMMRERPFRSPHHTVTSAALVGGGGRALPGEATLAHRGVLFLDEIAEFSAHVLDSLRTPCEERQVRIARYGIQRAFPSDFVLVAASNPCPCGNHFEEKGLCQCSPVTVRNYMARISGPFLDRMDIQVQMLRVAAEHLPETIESADKETMDWTRERIRKVWDLQLDRNEALCGLRTWNARIPATAIETVMMTPKSIISMAAVKAESHRMSVRGFHKSLLVARTIADLEGREEVSTANIGEAFLCRVYDKGGVGG